MNERYLDAIFEEGVCDREAGKSKNPSRWRWEENERHAYNLGWHSIDDEEPAQRGNP